MVYSVIPTEKFKKEAKRLIKKYPSLKDELNELASILTTSPKSGIDLGYNTYKIRLAIKSKGKGKKGGGRIITYLLAKQKEICLLLIYDKSEFDSIDDRTIKSIIMNLNT